MTLFVVPVLYDLLNGKRMRAREIQMIKETAGMNGDEVLEDAPAPGVPVTPVAPATPADPAAPVAPAPEAPMEAAGPVEPAPEPKAEPAPVKEEAPPVPVFAPRSAPAAPAKPIRIRLGRTK